MVTNPSRNTSSPMTTMTASGRGQNRPVPGRPAGTGDARGTAKLPNISRTTPGNTKSPTGRK